MYYYAIVIKHPVEGKAPIPVAELITSDHTVLSLCYFMETFRRTEGLIFGFSSITYPLQFIIDHSMVLLLSILHVYNSESLQDYLERTFRIVTGSGTVKDFRKVSPHACTSHVMHSASKNCKKWQVKFNLNIKFLKKYIDHKLAQKQHHQLYYYYF